MLGDSLKARSSITSLPSSALATFACATGEASPIFAGSCHASAL
jgi:hypothetical protein